MKAFAALGLTAGIAVALRAAPAAAQTPSEPVGAQLLFERGREAMDAGHVDDACRLFTESLRLDVAVGTLFNLAACEERQGNVASAWAHLREGLGRMPDGDPRARPAEARVAALTSRLPWLTIALADGAPQGTRVFRDAVELAGVSLGTPLPVNPGAHVVRVEAPGRDARDVVVTVVEGERRSLAVSPAPLPAAAPPRPAGPVRTAAWITGGAGVAAIGAGLAFGVVAFTKAEQVRGRCDATGLCYADGLTALDETRAWATASTVGVAVGAGLVATSAVLFLVSKPGTSARVGVAPHGLIWRF